MNDLLKPVAALMGTLKYPMKFATIFLIILIPVSALCALIIKSEWDDKKFIEKELSGLQYYQALHPLLEHFPAHRSLTNTFLRGNRAVENQIAERRKKIDVAMTQLAAVDKQLNPSLNSYFYSSASIFLN